MKMCKLCGKNPEAVPDRDTPSLAKRVCSECHANRIRDDMVKILELRDRARNDE